MGSDITADKTSGFFTRAIYAIAALLFAGVLLAWHGCGGKLADGLKAAAFAVVCCAAAFALGKLKFEIRLKDGWLALAVAGVCLVVKLIAVLRWRVEPAADYMTFYTTAKDLAETGSISLHRYVALFPHIYGYSAFLSIFYRIFGAGKLVAPIVNAVLSAVTAALLYLLVRRYGSKRAAIAAAALWTFCPSQTLYNIYVLSEPLYTAELVGTLLLADTLRRRLKAFDRATLAGSAGVAAGLGALLALIQLARPIAAIILIALAGVFVCVDLPYGWKTIAARAGALAVAAAVMLAVTTVAGLRIDSALGEPRATSVGYSYAVGLNEASGGRWDANVSARLMEYSGMEGASADYAQRRMMEDTKLLIKSGTVDYMKLAKTKFENLLCHDNSVVTSYGVKTFARQDLFAGFCDAFYIACALMSLAGAICALVRKERGVLIVASIFGIGLVAAQLLVEVAIRYHYSLYLAMIPLSVYFLQTITHLVGRKKQNG